MKRLFLTLLAGFFVLAPAVVGGGLASANNTFIPVCNSGSVRGTDASSLDVCKDVNAQGTNSNPIIKILRVAIYIVSFIAGAAAIILIMISAIRFITAGGEAAKVAQARGALTYALVGIAVTALAQIIVVFILKNKF